MMNKFQRHFTNSDFVNWVDTSMRKEWFLSGKYTTHIAEIDVWDLP